MQPRLLGRNPSAKDQRNLRIERYATPALAPPPPTFDNASPVKTWLEAGNDRYGDCVTATAAHILLALRTANNPTAAPIPNSAVIEQARRINALEGFSILERNKIWRNAGLWNDKTTAFAAADPSNRATLKTVAAIFGATDIGLNMPAAWQTETLWTVGIGRKYRPNSWGGHSVPIVAYDGDTCTVVTWGHLQKITWAAIAEYCDEAYAIISPDYINATGKTPRGFDLEALTADLTAVTK